MYLIPYQDLIVQYCSLVRASPINMLLNEIIVLFGLFTLTSEKRGSEQGYHLISNVPANRWILVFLRRGALFVRCSGVDGLVSAVRTRRPNCNTVVGYWL